VLDRYTLIVIIALIDVMAVIVLFILWHDYKSKFKGIFHWTSGTALSMSGVFISLLNFNENKVVSMTSALIIIAGAVVILEGMKRFFKVYFVDLSTYIIVSLLFMVYLIFAVYYSNMLEYQIIFLTAIGAFIFAKSYLFIRQLPLEQQKQMIVLRILVLIFILTSVFYIVYLMLPMNYVFNDIGIFGVLYTGYALLLTFQLVIMVNRRLQSESFDEHKKFGVIFYESPHAMLMIHQTTGAVSETNQAFTQLFGYSENEIIGKDANSLVLFNEIKKHIKNDDCLIHIMNEQNEEFYLKKKDQQKLPVLISKRTIQFDQENYYLISFKDITKINHSKQDLEYQANHDFLTCLPNRRWLQNKFNEAITRANKENHLVGIVLCDIDRFKDINDQFGHIVGDQILIKIGQRMQNIMGEKGSVIRFGGDEFIILISKLTAIKQINDCINQLKTIFKNTIVVDDKKVFVSVSFGHAIYPDDGLELNDLLRYSDSMMYKDKSFELNLKK